MEDQGITISWWLKDNQISINLAKPPEELEEITKNLFRMYTEETNPDYIDADKLSTPACGLPAFADWLQTECPLFRTFEDWLSDVYPEGDGRWFQFCTDRRIWELDNPDRTDRQDVS